jgi:hypothetical protein
MFATTKLEIYLLLTNVVALIPNPIQVVLVCTIFHLIHLRNRTPPERFEWQRRNTLAKAGHLPVSRTSPFLKPLVQRFIKTIYDQEVSAMEERVGKG